MDELEIQNRLERYYLGSKEKKQIVTVFLLTHQRPHYVSLMIDSILKQTYSNFYLIVLDNMSGDNTKEAVESFNDDRIIYLERESNAETPITNFMFAFKVCKTKYLTIFHDDDLVKNIYLKEMLERMEQNDDISCLSCQADLIDLKGNVLISHLSTNKLVKYCGNRYIQAFYVPGKNDIFPCFPSVIYRKSFYKDIEVFIHRKAGPASDQMIYFETCRLNGIVAVFNKALYCYRFHKSQDSSRKETYLTMDYLLTSYIYNLSYYHDFFEKEDVQQSLKQRLKTQLIILLNNSNDFYEKEDIRNTFKTIPNFYHQLNTLKQLLLIFRIACISPSIVRFFIKIKRSLMHNKST